MYNFRMATHLEGAIESFLLSCRIDRGASDHTVEAYQRDLLQLAAFLGPGRALESVEAGELDAYVLSLGQKGQKPASLARKISVIRQFFRFGCLELGLGRNPADQLLS